LPIEAPVNNKYAIDTGMNDDEFGYNFGGEVVIGEVVIGEVVIGEVASLIMYIDDRIAKYREMLYPFNSFIRFFDNLRS
jgi:hypothetical protein